jgi:hypothetical protein
MVMMMSTTSLAIATYIQIIHPAHRAALVSAVVATELIAWNRSLIPSGGTRPSRTRILHW